MLYGILFCFPCTAAGTSFTTDDNLKVAEVSGTVKACQSSPTISGDTAADSSAEMSGDTTLGSVDTTGESSSIGEGSAGRLLSQDTHQF